MHSSYTHHQSRPSAAHTVIKPTSPCPPPPPPTPPAPHSTYTTHDFSCTYSVLPFLSDLPITHRSFRVRGKLIYAHRMFCLLLRRSREPGGRGYVRGAAYGSVSGAHAKDTDILGCSINKDYAGMCVRVSVCLGFSDTRRNVSREGCGYRLRRTRAGGGPLIHNVHFSNLSDKRRYKMIMRKQKNKCVSYETFCGWF